MDAFSLMVATPVLCCCLARRVDSLFRSETAGQQSVKSLLKHFVREEALCQPVVVFGHASRQLGILQHFAGLLQHDSGPKSAEHGSQSICITIAVVYSVEQEILETHGEVHPPMVRVLANGFDEGLHTTELRIGDKDRALFVCGAM